MPPLIAVDTNILVYAEGFQDEGRSDAARNLLNRIPPDRRVLPAQVLGELYYVLVRKARFERALVSSIVNVWSQSGVIVPTSVPVFSRALDLATAHRLQIWDAVVLAAAASVGATVLLSEDMQHGAVLAGVTIVNPFLPEPHPLLSAALPPLP